jgi:hypothetical protein
VTVLKPILIFDFADCLLYSNIKNCITNEDCIADDSKFQIYEPVNNCYDFFQFKVSFITTEYVFILEFPDWDGIRNKPVSVAKKLSEVDITEIKISSINTSELCFGFTLLIVK